MITYQLQKENNKVLLTYTCQIGDKFHSGITTLHDIENIPNDISEQWLRDILGNEFVDNLIRSMNIQISIYNTADK